jgi:hypothetical protein
LAPTLGSVRASLRVFRRSGAAGLIALALVMLVAVTSVRGESGTIAPDTSKNNQFCTTGQVAGLTGLVLEFCASTSYNLFQPVSFNLAVRNVGTSFVTLRFAYNANITGAAWSASQTSFGLCADLVCVFGPGDSFSQTTTFVTAPPAALLFWRNPAPPGEYLAQASLLACHLEGFLISCDQQVATTSLLFSIVPG